MTAIEKAKDLVNMYYNHTATQKQAIETAERVVLSTLCKEIDSFHAAINRRENAFDDVLVLSTVKRLKNWQEVAVELQALKDAIAID